MSNYAWRFNRRQGVAYLEDRKLVEEILKLGGSRMRTNDAIMATYFSPRGKPFAWQVMFSMERWDDVSRALGLEVETNKPAVSGARPKSRQIRRGEYTKPTRPAVSQPGRKRRI